MKVDAENKLKSKTRENVIKIEDECLQKLFVGRTMKLKKADKRAELAIVLSILEQQYKLSCNCRGEGRWKWLQRQQELTRSRLSS